MHDTFFFIRQITASLSQKLPGFELMQCFSQSKDELILGFGGKKEDFWLKATFLPHFCLLYFPTQFQRAKKNSIDLMAPVIGKQVISLHQFENERAFSIIFSDGFDLVFKLFGNKANIVLLENGTAIEVFHKKFSQDLSLKLDTLERSLDTSLPLEQSPLIGRQLSEYLRTYPQSVSLSDILNPSGYYLTQNPPQLWLFRPVGKSIAARFDEAISAANGFYESYLRTFGLEQAKNNILQKLAAQIAKGKSYLIQGYSRLEQLNKDNPHERAADLLMAYPHLVTQGSEWVELPDFETGEPIRIRLNEKLSPQKNAENYYRKAKNRKIEIQTLQSSIAAKEQAIRRWQTHYAAIEGIEEFGALKKYLKANGLESNTEQTPAETFKTTVIEGFTVYIGKNAQQNDLLLRHSAKDDLWLHVRDARGSHVVIKQLPGKVFPKTVLERAAELAAFYSERRHDSLCAVIYTPRKYVRKRKGDEPGQVIVDKEQVILVWPRGLD